MNLTKFSFLNLFENDFLALFPELYLLTSIIILLFFGLYAGPQWSSIANFSEVHGEATHGFAESSEAQHSHAKPQLTSLPCLGGYARRSHVQQSHIFWDLRVASPSEAILASSIQWLSLWALLLVILLLDHNPITHLVLFYNTLLIDDFTYSFKFLLVLSSFCAILLYCTGKARSNGATVISKADQISGLSRLRHQVEDSQFEFILLLMFLY